jgi:hypothetical protein
MAADVFMQVLDGKRETGATVRVADGLIRRSQRVEFFSPGQSWEVTSIEQVRDVLTGVRLSPYPWVIGGRLSDRESFRYDGPFAYDSFAPEYGEEVAKLLKGFDWAAFSYFTTYHDRIVIIFTQMPELVTYLTQENYAGALLGRYCAQAPLLPHLKNATFYDYAEEGWLPYELARERGENTPLLLTLFASDDPDYYRRYNHEVDELEDFIWYEEPLGRLEQLREFTFPAYGGMYSENYTYRVHRAVDFNAYCTLWSMASHDCGIAHATLSADCDLDRLEARLQETTLFDIVRHAESVGTWAYGQIYGGGANEHHAVFHSRDASATHRIWQMTGDSAISRF